MPKIGIIYGMENTFPSALVERINSKNIPDVTAEHIRIGGIKMAEPSGYRVIIDRISHDIEFYRAYLKNAVLTGTIVINNPFWWSADDKFFNYALASKLGVAVPNTVVLPHKMHPPGTTVQSMRNLIFPLNWDEIFEYVGFPAFLKPFSGGGWKNVFKVNSPEEFFAAYDQTGTHLHDAAIGGGIRRIFPLLCDRAGEGSGDEVRSEAAASPAICQRRSAEFASSCTIGW